MEALGDGARPKLAFELSPRDAVFQADIELCSRGGLGDVPHLGLRFPAERGRLGKRGMNLQRELLPRIENLDEQGESVAVRLGPTQKLGCVLLHEPTQVLAGERAVRDDAHVTRPVADFPRFPDRYAGWQRFMEKTLQLASAPDALLEDRPKGEGIEHSSAWLRRSAIVAA